MVIPLGPGKFYGSSLPRPRIYTDIKHNTERVDPPISVLDPFLSWANEAHWSMGGLNFKRLRFQGRIEGNIKRLRNEREKHAKNQNPITQNNTATSDPPPTKNDKKGKRVASVNSDSPPPAPVVTKRRRFLALSDEEESENEEEEEREKGRVTRRLARKLGDDFDRVANKGEKESRSERGDVVMKKVKGKDSDSVGVGSGIRTSPRLAKKRLS